MLEGLVAWVLNNYLGKYVENLNTDQLSIALLSGEVELENLPLKKEALQNIGLPIEIKAGFIGKVRLQIPVRQIRTASWTIVIEQLYLVAGPICIDEYDTEAEKQALVDYKLGRLESLEARWRADMDLEPGYYATSYSSWLNYGTSLVTNVIENLQLNIKDVHLRFEDATSPDGSGVAFGVIIDGLTAQSCDASWSPGATSWNILDASYKLMELNGLSLYWNNVEKEKFFGNMSLGDLAVAMSQTKKQTWDYILSPVNSRAHVKRDRAERPLRSVNKPRIIVNLSLDEVPLFITDRQYKEMVNCVRSLEEIDRQRSQRRCRPTVPVSESPKDWWVYMARCYIGKNTLKAKISWNEMIERGRNNKLYVEACTKLLGSPTSILPPETKAIKDKIELERGFDELRVLRELAMYRVMPPKVANPPKNTNSPQAQGMLVQWFPQWWGWHSKAPEENSSIPTPNSSSTFDGELLDVLADTIDDDTLLRRDTVFGLFNFSLSKGAISLCVTSEDKATAPKTVMELQFEKVHLSYESRPRSGSHKFYISLGALYLHDYLTENSTFPILVQPQTAVPNSSRLRGSSSELSSQVSSHSLFELTYEKKPLHQNVDHSLHINSRSLDVVYNPSAIQWLIDFLCEPHRYLSNQKLQAMKRRTQRRLMKNWEQILEGDFDYRSSWDLKLNISAPQILLIEKFTDSNAAVIVVDFGRLHLSNNIEGRENNVVLLSPSSDDYDDEEYERFETPCSTPPGSHENSASAPIEIHQGLSEMTLHNKLYDHYSIDLSDLQIVVGKVKENWKHARTRVTSSLHLLERFNISLQIERRVVTTTDPHFPSVTISGVLPKLVLHINEQKVQAIRLICQLLSKMSASPSTTVVNDSLDREKRKLEEEKESIDDRTTQNHAIMVQFIIDRMTFELQSRGRSVAELQVSGVKAALTKRASDLCVSLSVHGLLLVDALQEFGPDFELLIASHKHVCMDSISGSLRDSEPTSPVSPVSPGSPDHAGVPRRLTSPIALNHALTSLPRSATDAKSPFSPKSTISMGLDQMDSEALIAIELIFVEGDAESIRVANIQFNNLDIIANQGTIVELMGFVKRLFPSERSRSTRLQRQESQLSLASDSRVSTTRTEITFDFHRLNVLFLRAVMQDGNLTGQKIATATMSDARIEATLGADISISGSLGGLQILDQTTIGKTHQRILSVGRDPLVEDSSHHSDNFPAQQSDALQFSLQRSCKTQASSETTETLVEVSVRMGSVWYTHAPHLISELRSCADEFKQYLSNLARQIGAAATDMAMGLVHADDWTIPQRKRLLSISMDGSDSAATNLSLKLDVVLDSPVLVVPRSSQSLQVFVAHLGTMTLQHEPSPNSVNKQKLTLEVRDMNLYSLNVAAKSTQAQQGSSQMPTRAEEMYCCEKYGKPILHDTLLKVEVERELGKQSARSPGYVLLDSEPSGSNNPVVQVRGVVVQPLKVSLSRAQYEQLQDTIHQLFSIPAHNACEKPQISVKSTSSYASEKFDLSVKVLFELPVLSVQLKQDRSEHQPLVELSMRDLVAKYEKLQRHESTMQVALRSLLMEDLLCPVGSRHRYMMQSSAPNRARVPRGVSRSCPDLASARHCFKNDFCWGSLPDRLESDVLYGAIPAHWRRKSMSLMDVEPHTPNTPPPSPGAVTSEENLVLISVTTVTQSDSNFAGRKTICVDFNCLDLVIRVESWMVVLDFLGIGSPSSRDNPDVSSVQIVSTANEKSDESFVVTYSETEVEVRSLTLVLIQLDREVAKANVSDVTVHVLKERGVTRVNGFLGSMSLLDLTSHGRLYRERFLISGRKALNFQYSSFADSEDRPHDAQLKLQMSAVHYVHTQRFVAELEAFFVHFSRLRSVMADLQAGGGAVVGVVDRRNTRLSLELHAGAPIILLPVSSRSDEMILLDLGELTARNTFELSKVEDGDRPPLLLDIMSLELVNMDIYAAKRLKSEDQTESDDILSVSGFVVKKSGHSLLTDKCHLKLRVERNLDSYLSRDIPDWSVYGTLSTMDCALDPEQYMLIRGLLSYNIGENLDDLRSFMQDQTWSVINEAAENANVPDEKVWVKSYMNFELVNVTLKLHSHRDLAALACVNFIKSKLTVDSMSDGSQDTDLISQEILIADTRFDDEPVNRRSNVFRSILQPLNDPRNNHDRVQAEIHHKRRKNVAATKVLLHSMRLTAILDWWEAVKDFLVLNSPEPEAPNLASSVIVAREHENHESNNDAAPFTELRLNITDSELVIVEDTSLWDTNAVILKSTAVLSYHSNPHEGEKPLSCNLSHCELFSCILGLEEETALSIIDPVGASFELTKDRRLEVQLQPLSVRLSYYDVNMFTRMLNSLPKQTLWAKKRSSSTSSFFSSPSSSNLPANAMKSRHIAKLSALGFSEVDCEVALDKCNGHLDDAALWLTQNATPIKSEASTLNGNESFFQTVEVETACLRICIIDDCRDADVPLLELTLADLNLKQERARGLGSVSASFTVDYYNRVLSGWEPFIEPWRAKVKWEQTLASNLSRKRLQVRVESKDSVNVNVTHTLVQLVSLVKENWTQDYYVSNGSGQKTSVAGQQGYRRRSPFIPFALNNETGSKLWFKTYISSADDLKELGDESTKKELQQRDETWLEVPTGETVPFTFEGRGKLRHHSTHIVRRHQVAVLVEGWRVMEPVSVDKVGVYFRHALPEEVSRNKARVVFDVELEGSARKLVTVRSALQIVNKLSYPVDVKLTKSLNMNQFRFSFANAASSGRVLQIPAQSEISVPLTHTATEMSLRPIIPENSYQYCMEWIDWSLVKKQLEVSEVHIKCKNNQNELFRACVAVRRNNYPVGEILPGHTVTILAPVTLTNLLPHELTYKIGSKCRRIAPGESSDLHSYDVEEALEIVMQLENYPGLGSLLIPKCSSSFTSRLRMADQGNKVLFLQASVVVEKGFAVRINISAPYWIINKTGLPLVFRQEGVGTEFAGQFEEHEKARMVAPLLFSFSDEEASRTLAVRVGTGIHPYGVPQWSQHFHLYPGVQVHRLRVTLRDNRPDIVYLIGVATRMTKGRYRATTIVTLSPRYQLHNRSSTTLELAQKCFTTTISHPDAQATYITATPQCHMPFHWPRLDKDQLLCVRIVDVPDCMWSGGILLQGNHSLTINVRDASARMHFLRVDVVLQESTYFIVFTDANTMPPPIRVDNFSEVPLNINQTEVPDNFQWTVRPHTSMPYALDEPTLPAALVVTAPGGIQSSYDLNSLGENRGLTYENFIYIAFTATFKANADLGIGENNLNPLDVEEQQLVLEAGPNNCVLLRKQQYGNRSQLWRMTSEGQLQHEGSSPPRDKINRSSDNVMVLDIAGPAPQPCSYCPLAIRRPDPRRKSTQTWKFTDDGRLCCEHRNMCVQSKDGFMGLHEGSEAVLGRQSRDEVPLGERVSRLKLRPGSGFLSIQVTTDGPTRVLQIQDIKEKKKPYAVLKERDWSNISVAQRPDRMDSGASSFDARELDLSVSLTSGLGLSIVSHQPVEELIFARFAGISLDFKVNRALKKTVDLKIDGVQIDNQLFEAQCTSVLYILPASRNGADSHALPAIHLLAEKLPSRNQNAEIYRQVLVTVKPVCVHLEEGLILKMASFVGLGWSKLDPPVDENDFNAQRFIYDVSAAHAKRYYFETLKLVPSQVKLSVLTSSKLPPHLQTIKKKLGLMLIKFEDASIELEPFIRMHPFESRQFLIHSILKHYKDELKWQAAIILGSVDFLGNPAGLVIDVSEGFSSLIYEGSVKSLVQNVTHGLSNSAAKVAESLSDGLGRVILDERHEEARQRIRANTDKSLDHLYAGFKGLGFGVLGGVTSIFKETYDGAVNEGFPGFVAGFGKGVVGTFTKPVVGVLDLATETASAIREKSRSAHRIIPKRDRPPRVASGPAGLLPPFNHEQAEGQEFLYSINDRDYTELFVAYEWLRSGVENLRVLVSNERVRIISGGTTKGVVTEVSLADLLHCQPTHKIESNGSTLHYIELISRAESISAVSFDGNEVLKRPKVRCDSEDVAKWVSQQINYAKSMYEERNLTLTSSDNILDDIQNYK